jgi:hypothetical protein
MSFNGCALAHRPVPNCGRGLEEARVEIPREERKRKKKKEKEKKKK